METMVFIFSATLRDGVAAGAEIIGTITFRDEQSFEDWRHAVNRNNRSSISNVTRVD